MSKSEVLYACDSNTTSAIKVYLIHSDFKIDRGSFIIKGPDENKVPITKHDNRQRTRTIKVAVQK